MNENIILLEKHCNIMKMTCTLSKDYENHLKVYLVPKYRT